MKLPKLASKLLILPTKTTVSVEDNLEIKRYFNNLRFLSHSAVRLLNPTPKQELFDYIGDQIYRLIGSGLAVVNEYLPAENSTMVRSLKGSPQDIKTANNILGKVIRNFKFKVDPVVRSKMIPEIMVRVEGGLYELAFNHLPKDICEAAEKSLGIRTVYVMPFTTGSDLLGTVAILNQSQDPLYNQHLIEAFINQAAVALKRNQIEEEYRSSEARFRAIFEDAAIGIALADMEGHPIEVNNTFQKMTGYSKEELLTKVFIDFTHQEDINLDKSQFNLMKKGLLDSYEVEKRYTRKDQQTIWVHLRVSLLRDIMGKPKYTIGVLSDITEQKKTEDALKESSERLALALREAKIGFWDWNILTNTLVWSEKIEPFFGFNQGEFPGTFEAFLKRIHPDDRRKVTSAINDCIKKGAAYNIEHRVVWPDGNTRWVLETGNVIRDKKGKATRMLGIVQDITEKRETENRKDEFISIASHELKTPLAVLKGYTHIINTLLIKFKRPYHKSAFDYLAKMEGQINKLTILVNELLDVSRIQQGKLQLTMEEFRLDELLQELVEDIGLSNPSHKIIIASRLKDVVTADKFRLSQVINNLLVNAIKYSPKADQVIVKMVKKGSNIIISFQDFGIGIPEDAQGKIFQPFYRVGNMADGKFPGLGMGLHICFDIINLHGGKIWFKSVLGKGSTFFFSLPLN